MLLTVAYDGADYAGWARQTNAPSVSGVLDRAIVGVDPAATLVRGASRTDAGVHARGQIAAFDTTREIDGRGWVHALNDGLPPNVAVVRAAPIAAGFQPRRAAVQKRYRYTFLCSALRDPFWEGRAWRVGYRLNHEILHREIASLLGTHDFRGFRSIADDRAHTVRTIRRAEVRARPGDPRCLELIVEGDGFMHNMVRIIAGTLLDVARGHLGPGAFLRALDSGSRRDLGTTAPATGLCLDRIDLGGDDFPWWPVGTPAID